MWKYYALLYKGLKHPWILEPIPYAYRGTSVVVEMQILFSLNYSTDF